MSSSEQNISQAIETIDKWDPRFCPKPLHTAGELSRMGNDRAVIERLIDRLAPELSRRAGCVECERSAWGRCWSCHDAMVRKS